MFVFNQQSESYIFWICFLTWKIKPYKSITISNCGVEDLFGFLDVRSNLIGFVWPPLSYPLQVELSVRPTHDLAQPPVLLSFYSSFLLEDVLFKSCVVCLRKRSPNLWNVLSSKTFDVWWPAFVSREFGHLRTCEGVLVCILSYPHPADTFAHPCKWSILGIYISKCKTNTMYWVRCHLQA